MKRYALLERAYPEAAAYMPANYTATCYPELNVTLIEGEDVPGWTLDDYVIPRLASGLMHAKEIDLSHPIMKSIPA
jgi:hypothetical protein